jgi:hypothetical protein
VRWGWPVIISVLLAAGLLLAWADSTAFRGVFPYPFPQVRPRGLFRPAEVDIPPGVVPIPRLVFGGLGPAGGIYTFWWFLSAGASAALLVLGTLVVMPGRARRAAGRVQPASLSLFFAAGVATVLLVFAVSELMRETFVLLSVVPFLWAISLVGIVFGAAGLALAFGRWLRDRVGQVHPLIAAFAAVLFMFDVALVPVAGWIALAVAAVAALGVAVVTRLGSPAGWSLEELDW